MRTPEHELRRERFLVIRRLYGPGGMWSRTCGAMRRDGLACRRQPLREQDRCAIHSGKRRFNTSPERAIARRIEARWRRDPWAHGATLLLPPDAEGEMWEMLASVAPDARAMPPSVVDKMRWAWRRAFIDAGSRPNIWQEAAARLPRRTREAGPPPLGWSPIAPPWTQPPPYVVDGPAVLGSKRRRDRPAPVAHGSDIRPWPG